MTHTANHTVSPPVSPRMPAEWEPHERTWMAFPPSNSTFGDPTSEVLATARTAWWTVARTIARYEPVTMLAHPDDREIVQQFLNETPTTPYSISILYTPLDDAWMRDSGPTFISTDAGMGAVNWIFNGWGAQSWARWDHDQHLARFVASHESSALAGEVIDSPMVAEGGGLHVNGEGTILLTETVSLDPGRNPEWAKQQIEAEYTRTLGVSHFIWLPRGLTRDYDEFGTRGHVDIVASFTESGAIVLHTQNDPEHPDYEVTRTLKKKLTESLAKLGMDNEIIDLPAPSQLKDEEGWVDYSYINHYVCNGAVILCSFNDPEADAAAAEVLKRCYPSREIELVDARTIFAAGGGIHCITQQQPAPIPVSDSQSPSTEGNTQ